MSNNLFESFTQEYLRSLLLKFKEIRIGVLGDFCLDVYWLTDLSASEPSLETGLPTRPVAEQRYELGGAGNVLNNIAAIGCGGLEPFGVIGPDPLGREMSRLLADLNVRSDGLLLENNNWATMAYVKPYERDEETSRLDFGNFNRLPEATADRLLSLLKERLDYLDVVVINQQVRQGIHTGAMRSKLAGLIQKHPEKIFIVDSRHFADAYPGAYLKIGDHEATRQIGIEYPANALVLKEDVYKAAKILYEKAGRPVFISRGARGVVVHDKNGLHDVPGILLLERVDPVGAGDSMLAGLALALAAGAAPVTAAIFGNIVASITVQKIKQTGTAAAPEILAVGAQPDYVYRPELAEDPRQIRIVENTEFEQVSDRKPPVKITHAIFDHDGTISTLREGWERIMGPMMIRAILGPRYESADDSLYHRVVDRVSDFIDKSTGIQTLLQMRGLVKMVREFGCVRMEDILDEHGYKKIYNDALLQVVRQRIAKLKRNDLDVEDYTLKNAVRLLEALHRVGVRLYLASGTDEQDVFAEANALGYAGFFEGHIYGAVGDATKEAKRIVLDRILREIGKAEGLVTFGDGPVEIRETHKRGGFTIGVASDELRRFGLNSAKRSRLIHAGADMIIPDFSQLESLLRLLNIKSRG